jgi:predicted polyphosphate/ATP-dependent NAD kinase
VVVILQGGDGTLAEAHLAVRYRTPVIALLTDVSRMAGLSALPITTTDQLPEVEAFIRQAPLTTLASAFKLEQTSLPQRFRLPDF